MDPVTHGLIGASFAQTAAKKERLGYAALIGGAAAMLPDLDVLISSSNDPLLQLEYHRQFSHSFLFAPVGALIASFLFWWILRSRLSFKSIFVYSLAGILTAGLTDTFTSYGVQLLWPFSENRYAWNLISVFDPLLSLGVAAGLAASIYYSSKKAVWGTVGWLGVYIVLAFLQHQKAEELSGRIIESNNHAAKYVVVKPTIANELLWSIRYVHEDTLFAYGVQMAPFSEPVIYRGEQAPLLDWRQKYADYSGTVLYDDIRRFSNLSEGILVAHPEHPQILGDGRYAILPTSVSPLWGIRADTSMPGRHVQFNSYRDVDEETRHRFVKQLLGN